VISFRGVSAALLVLPIACGGSTASPVASPATAPPTASASAAVEEPAVKAKGPFPQSHDPALRDPSKASQQAPATFTVAFVTTVGEFRVDCTRDWAPNGVDRFYNLVRIGFFDDVAFFRVVKQPSPYMVQFGIHGDPEVSRAWINARIPADKPKQSNMRGTLTFAMAGPPDTRTTQLFINFGANVRLDQMGFAPVCKVSGDGMDVVDKIEGAYGEEPSEHQGEIQTKGNAMLRAQYPFLDYIQTARLVDPR
jgi:peptidyl-prolyl cis-trans isomerase A (cyclophilin A)